MSVSLSSSYTTQVICLKSIEFGDSDKILTVYSPDYGKLGLIVKGVKKPKSKLAGAAELLSVSQVHCHKGKSLDVLVQYEPQEQFFHLRQDLLRLAYGLLFGELLLHTVAEGGGDCHEYFAGAVQALQKLNTHPDLLIVPTAISSQLNWLRLTGYQPVLDQCIFTGDSLDTSRLYHCFSPSLGGATTPEEKHRHTAVQDWINVSSKTLLLLQNPSQNRYPDNVLKAQKFLQFYADFVFGKTLQSFALILALLSQNEPIPPALPE